MKIHRWPLVLVFCVIGQALHLNAQIMTSAKPPAYPLAARAAGIDGPVTLRGTISKEGKMQDIHVLSGPPELRQAAIEAVKGWTYKPYRHFGRIVEVDTTVTVNFNMGVGQQKVAEQAKAKAELAKSMPSQDGQQPPTPNK